MPTPSVSSASQPAGASNSASKQSSTGAIAGSITSVLAALIIGLLVLLWWRRKRASTAGAALSGLEPYTLPVNHNDMRYRDMEASPAPEFSQTTPAVRPYSGKRGDSAFLARLVPPHTRPSLNTGPGNDVTSSSTGANLPVISPTSLPESSRYTHSVEPPSSAGQTQTVDVNQLIELIAQRIDPAAGVRVLQTTNDGEVIPPPQYPV